jgi:hypothetical protein
VFKSSEVLRNERRNVIDNPVHSTESSSSTMDQKKAVTPLLMPPSVSFTAPTPEGSPAGAARVRAASEGPSTVLRPPTPTRSHSDGSTRGKRKADDVESGASSPKDTRATATLDPRRVLFQFICLRIFSDNNTSPPSVSFDHLVARPVLIPSSKTCKDRHT